MATKTENYGLVKPDPSDFQKVEDLNRNFDIIDEELKKRVPSSGWAAGKVLGTDADGNVITMDPPAGGATEEQLAQIQTNKQNIEAIQTELDESPVVVDENGYTDIVGLRRGVHTDFVFADEQITVTTTMQGGVAVEGVLTFGTDGLPEKYTEDGIEHTMTWTGFENAAAASGTEA